jgi:hypothetical protein
VDVKTLFYGLSLYQVSESKMVTIYFNRQSSTLMVVLAPRTNVCRFDEEWKRRRRLIFELQIFGAKTVPAPAIHFIQ